MRQDKAAAQRSQAGFTLLELLAVIVIVALAAGAVAFYARSSPGRPQVKAAAVKIAALMRGLRNRAINQRREEVVLIDIVRRIIHSESSRHGVRIPAGIAIAVIAADSEARSKRTAGLRFFPNGSSTGAAIKLSQGGRSHEVRINWLTGRVSQIALP